MAIKYFVVKSYMVPVWRYERRCHKYVHFKFVNSSEKNTIPMSYSASNKQFIKK